MQSLVFDISAGLTSSAPEEDARFVSAVVQIAGAERAAACAVLSTLIDHALEAGRTVCFRLMEHPEPDDERLANLPGATFHKGRFSRERRTLLPWSVSALVEAHHDFRVLAEHLFSAIRVDMAVCQPSQTAVAQEAFEQDDHYDWSDGPLRLLAEIAECVIVVSARGSEMQLVSRREREDWLKSVITAAACGAGVSVGFR